MKFDTNTNKRLLTHAVLASTIFLSPIAMAVNVGAGPLTTAGDPGSTIIFDLNNTAVVNITDGDPLASTPAIKNSAGGNSATQTVNFLGASAVGGDITKDGSNAINIVNLNGAGKLVAFAGNVTANTLNFNADGTATVAASKTLTANVTTATTNTGTLNFSGTNTALVGNIGSAGSLLKLVNINGASITTFNSTSVNATDIQITNAGGTLDFITTASTVNAAIDGPGILKNNVDGTIFNGTIGGTTPLALLNISANTTLNANATATATTVLAAKTLTINSGFDIAGPIDGAAGGVGIVKFVGNHTTNGLIGAGAALATVNIDQPGTFVMANNITATNVNITNGNKLTLPASKTLSGNLSVDSMSALSVAYNNTLTVVGALNMNGAINYDMANNPIIGAQEVTVGSTATFGAGSVVNVLNPYLAVSPGVVQVLNVAGAVNPIVGGANVSVAGSPFLNFVVDTTTLNTNLSIKATRIAAVDVAPQENLAGGAAALDGLIGNTAITGNLLLLVNQMNQFTDANVFRSDLATVVPLVDGAIVSSMLDVMDTTNQAIENSIAERKNKYKKHHASTSHYNTGYAAGDMDEKGRAVWVKAFGQTAKQKERKGITGFDADTYGFAAGGDVMISDNAMIGLAFSWASTEIDHDLNDANTDADNYRGTLYGSVDFSCPMYFNWLASAAYNDFTTQRYIRFGNVDLAPRGHYHAWQYEAKGEIGYIFGSDEFHTIPLVSLDYTHLDFHDYMETGAGTANQRVSYDNMDVFKLGAGVKFAYDYKYDCVMMQPEFHARAFYDVIGDRVETTSQFTGGGSAFQTIGYKPAQDSYNLGLSLTGFADNGFVFTASYDYNFKHEYDSHNGFLRVRYEW